MFEVQQQMKPPEYPPPKKSKEYYRHIMKVMKDVIQKIQWYDKEFDKVDEELGKCHIDLNECSSMRNSFNLNKVTMGSDTADGINNKNKSKSRKKMMKRRVGKKSKKKSKKYYKKTKRRARRKNKK